MSNDDNASDTKPAACAEASVGDSGLLDTICSRKRQGAEITEATPQGSGIGVDVGRFRILSPEQTVLKNRCEILRISPPKSEGGDIAEMKDIKNRVQVDGFDVVALMKNEDSEKILLFLYGRDFFRRDSEKRILNVIAMLEEAEGECPRKRVLQLINLLGDQHEESQLACPQAKSPFWSGTATNYGNEENADGNQTGCNIFTEKGSHWIQRVQRAGNCFLHAPIVVLSYSLFHSGATQVQAVDICKYARNVLNSDELAQFLVRNDGGSSILVLKNILEKKTTITHSSEDIFDAKDSSDGRASCELEIDFKVYGAGLVHHFRLGQVFCQYQQPDIAKPELPSFEGVVDPGKDEKYHAMVLVGMRKGSDGRWWLLLQNWWPHMQLVEVSQEYFLSCKAEISFVKHPPLAIRATLERCDKEYAEAEMEGSDIPERGCDEK